MENGDFFPSCDYIGERRYECCLPVQGPVTGAPALRCLTRRFPGGCVTVSREHQAESYLRLLLSPLIRNRGGNRLTWKSLNEEDGRAIRTEETDCTQSSSGGWWESRLLFSLVSTPQHHPNTHTHAHPPLPTHTRKLYIHLSCVFSQPVQQAQSRC